MKIDLLEKDLEDILLLDLSPEKYKQYYDELVSTAKLTRPKNDKSLYEGTFELHHIIPRCMDGKDDDDNLVLLSILEHIIAHLLLHYAYLENNSLKYAAWCMLSKPGGSENYNGRKIILDELSNLESFSRIREDIISSMGKEIVGYNDKFEVVRIYRNQELCRVDGFNPSGISNVISGKYNQSGGLFWDTLENFKINHQKEISDYYKLDKPIDVKPYQKNSAHLGSIKAGEKQKIPVVYYDMFFNVFKIYSGLSDTKEDIKGSFKHISSIINGKTYGRKTVAGYYWDTLENFQNLYPEKVKEYENSGVVPVFKPGNITFKSRQVVKFDIYLNVMVIYNSYDEAAEYENINSRSVYTILKSHKPLKSGDYFMTLQEFFENYPQKLKEYYDRK